MNLFKRFRQVIKVSKYPEELLDKQEALTDAIDEINGDGKAEFIGEGTEADWEEQEREDNGMKGIFGIGKRKIEVDEV